METNPASSEKWSLLTNSLILFRADVASVDVWMDYLVRNLDFHRRWSPLQPESWYEREAIAERMDRTEKRWAAGEEYRFWYALREVPERMIGHATLSNVVRGVFQSCHLGYSQDQEACGKGYMNEALQAVLNFAFTEADLHRVEANVVPANKASLAVLTRLGFRQEGEAKRYLKINGDWEDHLRFAMLKEEFTGLG